MPSHINSHYFALTLINLLKWQLKVTLACLGAINIDAHKSCLIWHHTIAAYALLREKS